MIVAPGTTSLSIDVEFLDDAGLPLTGQVASDFPTLRWSIGGNTAATTISLSDLSLITSSYSSGGIKERAGSSGIYRLDVPNAAIALAGRVIIYGDSSGKHVLAPDLDVQFPKADDRNGNQILGYDTGPMQITPLNARSDIENLMVSSFEDSGLMTAEELAPDVITANSLTAGAVAKIAASIPTATQNAVAAATAIMLNYPNKLATASDGSVSGVSASSSGLTTDEHDKLFSLTSDTLTLTSSVAADGSVEIWQGDDYLTADGRQITFTNSSYTGPSLSGGTATLELYASQGVDRAIVLPSYSYSGTITVSGIIVTIKFSLTHTQTALLAAKAWSYRLVAATSGGSVLTQQEGMLRVR
jgi:hypothetical protein